MFKELINLLNQKDVQAELPLPPKPACIMNISELEAHRDELMASGRFESQAMVNYWLWGQVERERVQETEDVVVVEWDVNPSKRVRMYHPHGSISVELEIIVQRSLDDKVTHTTSALAPRTKEEAYDLVDRFVASHPELDWPVY